MSNISCHELTKNLINSIQQCSPSEVNSLPTVQIFERRICNPIDTQTAGISSQ